jgi:hypothetical protein
MEYGATTLNLASIVEHHARLAPETGSDCLERYAFYIRAIKRAVESRRQRFDEMSSARR